MLALLIALVFAAGYTLALGLVVRWMLGAPVSAVRTIVTGAVGFFIIVPGAFLFIDAGIADTARTAGGQVAIGDMFVILTAGLWVLALAAAFLATLQLVWPSERSVGLVNRVRGGRDRFRRTTRYAQIVRIAMRHGLSPLLRGGAVSTAELGGPLVAAINDAGVTFVKFGQLLSTRRDIISPALADHLASLQTRAAFVDWSVMASTLKIELGRPLDEVFHTIDPTPLAAASIGQVHAATLRTGEAVVVKIQRPWARAQVNVDIDIAMRLCRRLETRSAAARGIGLTRLMAGLAASLREELDYRIERRNLDLIRAASARSGTGLRFPRTYPQFSTPRVLVTEQIAGLPLTSAVDELRRLTPSRRRELAATLVDAVLQQMLGDGVLHADLHGGNIIVCDDGRLALIDFGAVAILDRAQRDLLSSFLLAFRAENVDAALAALRHLTATDEWHNERELRADLGTIFTIAAVERDTAFLSDRLLQLFHRHRLAVSGSVAAAVRIMATLQEAVASIDRDAEYADLILARFDSIAARPPDPHRTALAATAQLKTLAHCARRLPNNLDIMIEAHAASVRTNGLRRRETRSWNLSILFSLSGCLLGGLLGAAGLVLILHEGGPAIPPGVPIFGLIGAVSAAIAVVIGTRAAIGLRKLATSAAEPESSLT